MNYTPFSMKIIKNFAMEEAYPFEFEGNSMETKTTTRSENSNRGKATAEWMILFREINKSPRAGL